MNQEKEFEYSYNHVSQRMWDRYGIQLNRKEYVILCEDISKHNTISLYNIEKQKNGTQYTYSMDFNDTVIYVVYNKDKELITTVLPPEHFEGK